MLNNLHLLQFSNQMFQKSITFTDLLTTTKRQHNTYIIYIYLQYYTYNRNYQKIFFELNFKCDDDDEKYVVHPTTTYVLSSLNCA